MKYFLGTIHETYLNCQYTHVVRFIEDNDHTTKERMESITATFYGNIGDPDDDGDTFKFKRGQAYAWLRSGTCKEISEKTYQELKGFADDH